MKTDFRVRSFESRIAMNDALTVPGGGCAGIAASLQVYETLDTVRATSSAQPQDRVKPLPPWP